MQPHYDMQHSYFVVVKSLFRIYTVDFYMKCIILHPSFDC